MENDNAWAQVEAVAQALLERSTLDYEAVRGLCTEALRNLALARRATNQSPTTAEPHQPPPQGV